MAATMREVAGRAGVSLVTVSRVINGHDSVRPATRAKVERAIADLQYVPDQLAGSLRSRQTNTLGLLLPTIANAFWTAIARGVEDEGEAQGYGVFLCNTDDDAEKEGRYLDVLLGRRVEGIVVVPTADSTAQLRRVQQRRMPLVQVHRKLEGVEADSIRADSTGGAAALTGHLLALGCRRIAFLGAVMTISPGRDCLSGFMASMAHAGVTVDPALVKIGPARPETGFALTVELLQDDRPDAICIGNSRLAVGALHALREAGLRVPGDIRVATFYDIAALDPFSPALITAVQPAYEIGRLGTRRLLERITGLAEPPVDILLPNAIAARPLAGIADSQLASVAG
jgi:LacI family transcriptional regulator